MSDFFLETAKFFRRLFPTESERLAHIDAINDFGISYPLWHNFILCSYPLYEFDNKNDKDAVEWMEMSELGTAAFIEEGKRMVRNSEAPWPLIAKLCCSGAESVEETKAWVEKIMQIAIDLN